MSWIKELGDLLENSTSQELEDMDKEFIILVMVLYRKPGAELCDCNRVKI